MFLESLKLDSKELTDLRYIFPMYKLLTLIYIPSLYYDFARRAQLIDRFLDLVVRDAKELLQLLLGVILLISHVMSPASASGNS